MQHQLHNILFFGTYVRIGGVFGTFGLSSVIFVTEQEGQVHISVTKCAWACWGDLTRQVHPQSSFSPTAGRLTLQVFHILPKNVHTVSLKGAFIPLVQFTVMADSLIDRNLWFFSAYIQCLLFLSLKLKMGPLPHWDVVARDLINEAAWLNLMSLNWSRVSCTCGVWPLFLCFAAPFLFKVHYFTREFTWFSVCRPERIFTFPPCMSASTAAPKPLWYSPTLSFFFRCKMEHLSLLIHLCQKRAPVSHSTGHAAKQSVNIKGVWPINNLTQGASLSYRSLLLSHHLEKWS